VSVLRIHIDVYHVNYKRQLYDLIDGLYLDKSCGRSETIIRTIGLIYSEEKSNGLWRSDKRVRPFSVFVLDLFGNIFLIYYASIELSEMGNVPLIMRNIC
jgi:hypothetical protein